LNSTELDRNKFNALFAAHDIQDDVKNDTNGGAKDHRKAGRLTPKQKRPAMKHGAKEAKKKASSR
jgi:hypothetical protein